MFNNKAKLTIYDRYDVENIRQCEEFVNICKPDKSCEAYQDFNSLVNNKVASAMKWLSEKDIEYTWNERIDNHLYRLYIPIKNLLFDFEFYPVNNINYNYIRINYDTDIIRILEKLFPSAIINTVETDFYKLNQKATNKFLRENGHSAIYDKSILRTALVKDNTIYQCMILRENKVIANVIKDNCAIPYGTYMLLRYLNEMLDIPEILIRESSDNSYVLSMYQLLGCPIISKTSKKKIWWNKELTKWHITEEEKKNFIPFYYTESITYSYTRKPQPLG